MAWYGEIYKTRIEKQLNEAVGNPDGWKWRVMDPQDKATTYGFLIMGKGSTGGDFKAVFQPYSACCAFHEMNFFSYDSIRETGEKEFVSSIMDHLLDSIQVGYHLNFGKKLVLNTVQRIRAEYHQSNMELTGKDFGEKGHSYPGIYAWAKAQKGGCIDTVIVNQNTGNLIHHLIVRPDVCN